jgi:hypothetical protein
MTEQDVPAFGEVLRGVAAVFHVWRDLDAMSPAYFKALRRFPLRQVADAGDRCTTLLKRFPKPVEWAELVARPTAAGLLTLSPSEAAAHQEAEACHYELPPCRCADCQTAGIFKPVRYVPDADDPRARLGDRVITRGHWAHGYELVRWYAARAAFWTVARGLGHRSTLLDPPALGPAARLPARGFERLSVGTREPGEEG